MGSLCSWPSTRDTVASISPYVLSSTSSFSRGSTVVLQGQRAPDQGPRVQPQAGAPILLPPAPHPAQGVDSHDLLQTLSG